MKQLFGALCAMVIAFSAAAPAGAQMYRDHDGWYGAGGAPMLASQPVNVSAPVMAAAATWRARRWTPRRTTWRRYYTAPARRTYRTYRRVWFGNKIVWWPTTTTRWVPRTTSRYRYASTRWTRGRRAYWHPGYWTTNQGTSTPGTWTPEPVYRYNPGGQQPMIMHAPAATRTVRRNVPGARTYPGYQYYYYGKPTSAAPGTPMSVRPPGRTTHRNASVAVPKDNIPTVYLYQRGHRQGIHLPAAAPKPAETPAPATAPGVAPGAAIPPGAPVVPGAPAPGGLIPGAAPGAAPGVAPVPAAPQVPAPQPSS